MARIIPCPRSDSRSDPAGPLNRVCGTPSGTAERTSPAKRARYTSTICHPSKRFSGASPLVPTCDAMTRQMSPCRCAWLHIAGCDGVEQDLTSWGARRSAGHCGNRIAYEQAVVTTNQATKALAGEDAAGRGRVCDQCWEHEHVDVAPRGLGVFDAGDDP